jgi:hypothetical protein
MAQVADIQFRTHLLSPLKKWPRLGHYGISRPELLRLDVGGDHKIVPFGKVHHDPLCQIGTRYPDRFQTER